MINNWYEKENKNILSNVHKKIIEYIGEGISRHNLLKWLEDENIDSTELKFLRDTDYIELVDNKDYKIKQDRGLNSGDFEVDL